MEIKLAAEVEQEALAIPERCEMLVVDSKEAMTEADEFKKAIHALIKEIDGTFKDIAAKAFDAHRAITSKWKETKQPLIDAQAVIVQKGKKYLREQEEIRLAEERRLREIARKAEEDRLLAEAEELEEEGEFEEAAAVLSEPIKVVTPVVKSEAPKVDKRSYKTTWKWRILDESKIPREFFTLDERKISGVVRALKGETKIPGIGVYED